MLWEQEIRLKKIFLTFSIVLGVAFLSLPAFPDTKTVLTETEAVVIGGFADQVTNMERAIRRVTFSSLDNANRFNFDYLSNSNRTLHKVTQNFYYLEAFETIFDNLAPIFVDKPEDYQGVLSIKGGSVTYIGIWVVHGKRTDVGFKLDATAVFDFEFLYDYLKKHPYLKDYPLYFSSPDKQVVQYEWDYVEAAAKLKAKEKNN